MQILVYHSMYAFAIMKNVGGKHAMAKTFSSSEQKLLQTLLQSNQYLSIDEIVERISFSRRSVYNFIREASIKLSKMGIDPPRNVRGKGYYLLPESKIQLREIMPPNSFLLEKMDAKDRKNMALLAMFAGKNKVTIAKLVEMTGVSHNTIVNDLDRIGIELEPYRLALRGDKDGHYIAGDELMVRNYIQEYLPEMGNTYSWISKKNGVQNLFNIEDINGLELMINDWIHTVEYKSNRSFSDDAVRSMELSYSFILRRILSHKLLSKGQFPTSSNDALDLKKQIEYQLANDFLLQFGIDVSKHEEEVFYLESLLLSGQLNAVGRGLEPSIKKIVLGSTLKIVENFRQLANCHFHDENQLVNELYVHLLSTYYRVKYRRQYHDGLSNSVKQNYPDIFTYTKISIRSFEELNTDNLNDNEVSLIVIYFGSQIYKDSNERKSILLVCSTGLGTSRLLKMQLEGMFPDLTLNGPITRRVYENLEKISDDVVLSTIPLNRREKEVIVVNPIMDEVDRNHLRKQLVLQDLIKPRETISQLSALLDVIADNTTINNQSALITGIKEILTFSISPNTKFERGYQPLLSELINENTIKFAQVDDMTWEEAIELAAKPLLEQGNIKQTYIDAMIANVNENGPYINIGDRVAFAHARPESGVDHLGMSLLCLDKPIDLVDSEHPIQLVFVLAAEDSRSHLKALSEFATILGDSKKRNTMLQAKTTMDVERVILDSEQNQE